jgi:carboxymethylenebutenolidase
MTSSFRLFLGAFAASVTLATGVTAIAADPETVHFPSADGKTELTGYLFRPAKLAHRGAVVMAHGRSGPYRSTVKDGCTLVARGVESPCNASTLSGRHVQWGEFWAARGYLALHVDSFGPRGKGHGFGRFTHGNPDREDVNEVTVRPLDAEGALAWLKKRDDVAADHIFLQGWSNGGSTTLNVMHRQKPGAAGFRAALSF